MTCVGVHVQWSYCSSCAHRAVDVPRSIFLDNVDLRGQPAASTSGNNKENGACISHALSLARDKRIPV